MFEIEIRDSKHKTLVIIKSKSKHLAESKMVLFAIRNHKAKRAIIRDLRQKGFTAYSQTEYVKL